MITVPQKGKSNHRQAAIDEKTANKFQLFFLFYFFCSPTYACAVLSTGSGRCFREPQKRVYLLKFTCKLVKLT